MTKYLSTPTNAVLVEIDISKHRQEILIEWPEGGRRRPMSVMATKDDYDRLVEELASMARPIVIGFEATGTPNCASAPVSSTPTRSAPPLAGSAGHFRAP